MTVTITLVTAGTNTGPFDLFSDVSVPPFSSAFDTNVPKSTLTSGFVTTNVPNGTTVIRVVSTGECTNYIDIPIEIPPACKEFTFQGTASRGNIVTYKDCATGEITDITLSNGESAVQCAYSDPLNYPVFTTGSGIITENGFCSTTGRNPCIQYLLFAIPGEGGATFRYIPCNENNSIETSVADGESLIVCVNRAFIPQVVTGEGSVTDMAIECTTTTTSTTTTPP